MNSEELQALVSHPVRDRRTILSVYLDVDQSNPANLNRGYETRFRDALIAAERTIVPADLELFRQARRKLTEFLGRHEVKGRGLALFFDATDGALQHRQLKIPVRDAVRWGREMFLQPLAAARDEFESYGVALVDRARARLFTVSLGEITEVVRESSSPQKVRHIKTVGMDHLGSSDRVQGKADEQVRRNLRRVAKDLDQLIRSEGLAGVVLAGASETTAELRGLLPKRLAERIIGSLHMDMTASPQTVLAAASRVFAEHEGRSEERMVDSLQTAAAKGSKAVVGLGRTLMRLNQERVWHLLYSEDFKSSGFECSRCAALFSTAQPTCLQCSGPLAPVEDVVERSVQRAMRNGAKIEVVKGEAASSLDSAGGIGAFLKSRTKNGAVGA